MSLFDNALIAAKHKEPRKVPTVLFCHSLLLKRYCGVSEHQYHQNVIDRFSCHSWQDNHFDRCGAAYFS